MRMRINKTRKEYKREMKKGQSCEKGPGSLRWKRKEERMKVR